MSCQRVVVAVVDGRRVLQLSAAAARGAIPIDCQSEDFVRVVRGAGGVDAAFDAIDGPHFFGSYRTLRRGGTLMGFGVSSAWSGGKANGPRAGLSLLGLLGLLGSNILPDGRHARFYTASRAINRGETYREDLGRLLELLAHEEIHPKVAVVLPLSQAGHARVGRAGPGERQGGARPRHGSPAVSTPQRARRTRRLAQQQADRDGKR